MFVLSTDNQVEHDWPLQESLETKVYGMVQDGMKEEAVSTGADDDAPDEDEDEAYPCEVAVRPLFVLSSLTVSSLFKTYV